MKLAIVASDAKSFVYWGNYHLSRTARAHVMWWDPRRSQFQLRGQDPDEWGIIFLRDWQRGLSTAQCQETISFVGAFEIKRTAAGRSWIPFHSGETLIRMIPMA